MSGPVVEPPFGPQHMAAYRLAQDRKHFPYGRDAVSRMSPAEAEKLAARLGLSSTGALELVFELLEKRHYEQVRAKIMEIGGYAGLELSDIGYLEILLGTPDIVTVRDENDGSLAIGIDPGFWHMIELSYLLAVMGKQVSDFFWFLALEYKAFEYFVIGKDTGAPEIIEQAVDVLARSDPSVQGMAADVLGTAVSFMLAHEVGHLALGHLQAGGNQAVRLDRAAGQKTAATIFRDQAKELAADVWAADALLSLAGTDFKQRTLAVTVPSLMFWLRAVPALVTRPPTEVGRALAKHYPTEAARATALHRIAAGHIPADVGPSNAMMNLLELGDWLRGQVTRWEADRAGQTRAFNEWCRRMA